MKKTISQLALLFAVASMVGCGLKGPLYFPADEPTKPQASTASPTVSPTQSGQTPATSTGQDGKPVQ